MTKPLTDMTLPELVVALQQAAAQRQAVEYQDSNASYAALRDAADAQKLAVEQEIDARLAALDVRELENKQNGG